MHAQVPAPGGWKNGVMPDSVLKALDDLQRDQPSTDAEALRFPLSCSEVLPGTDKAGQPCSTVDCIMHTDILAAAQQHRPLKAFLVELALEWVGSKHKMQLDPRFKLPKMAYKGSEVRSQRVRLDRKPLVEDVTLQQLQQEEPPNFPLMPTKAAATKVAAASSKAATAASKHEARQADVAADNGSQTRSSRLPAAAAAANESSNRSSRWQYSVKCEGKPVSYMLVTLQLPPAGNSGSSSSSWSASGIIAEVCGRQLRVTAAAVLSEDPCVVELPFAAGSEGAMAQLLAGGTHLQVRLPYLPLQQWVQQLATKSPHVFSKLPVAHQTYMELDE